jgi:soluble lytic murein transglycosylase
VKKTALLICAGLICAGALGLVQWWRHRIERRYDGLITSVAARYGLNPGVVKAVVWRESRFDAAARGKAGELGLMQVGEDAALEWADAEGIKGFSHDQCTHPVTNILAGSWYLRKALSKYQTSDDPLPYALAEYNAGRRNVLRWKFGSAETNSVLFTQQIGFPSTSNYVREIMAKQQIFSNEFKKPRK